MCSSIVLQVNFRQTYTTKNKERNTYWKLVVSSLLRPYTLPLERSLWIAVHQLLMWPGDNLHFHYNVVQPGTAWKQEKQCDIPWQECMTLWIYSSQQLLYLHNIPRNGKTTFLGAKHSVTLWKASTLEVWWWGLSLATSFKILLLQRTFSNL